MVWVRYRNQRTSFTWRARLTGAPLKILGDRQAPPVISEGCLRLAHILYEWNDLDAAEEQGQLGLQLAQQYDKKIDIFVMCEMFLSPPELARET